MLWLRDDDDGLAVGLMIDNSDEEYMKFIAVKFIVVLLFTNDEWVKMMNINDDLIVMLDSDCGGDGMNDSGKGDDDFLMMIIVDDDYLIVW